MGHKVIQCFTLWTCSEVGVFYCLHPSFLTFWFLVAWLLHQHWELYKKSFVDLFIDWIGGYKHYRMIFKTSGKDPFIKVQQVHPTIYKFNKLRNHREAVITTEISTPERHTHIFHATHIKIFLRALFSDTDTEAQLHWDCGAVTCHLERKLWHYPGIPLPWGSARGEGVGIGTEAEREAGHCVFSGAKGHCGPPLFAGSKHKWIILSAVSQCLIYSHTIQKELSHPVLFGML